VEFDLYIFGMRGLKYSDIISRVGLSDCSDLTLFNNIAQINRIMFSEDRSHGVKVDSDDLVHSDDMVLAFTSNGRNFIINVWDYIDDEDYLDVT
jgi:hypothetical protein